MITLAEMTLRFLQGILTRSLKDLGRKDGLGLLSAVIALFIGCMTFMLTLNLVHACKPQAKSNTYLLLVHTVCILSRDS